MNERLLSGLLLAMTAIWGWTFTVVKDAVAVYGVVSFLAARFAIGAACLGALGGRRLTRQSTLLGSLIGLILAAAYLFQTFGLRYTTATHSGLITSLFVLFAPLANRVLFGTPTPRVVWLAIGASLMGLTLLMAAGTSPWAWGDVVTLGAAVGFGLQIAILDRHARRHDPLGLALAQVLSAAAVLSCVGPWVEPFHWPSGPVWFALLLTGVVATAIGFYLQTLAQRQLSAARVAVIFSLEPVFAAFFGHWLAGDRLSAIQWFGAAWMFAAVLLAEVVPKTRAPDTILDAAQRVPRQTPEPREAQGHDKLRQERRAEAEA
jgi:drug/metabolite transporter (DMT)-like permease